MFRNDKEYDKALELLDLLMDEENKDSDRGRLLDLLGGLLSKYEEKEKYHG
jgi:antitoxin component HigA of HigAB toxin-antitoxin module